MSRFRLTKSEIARLTVGSLLLLVILTTLLSEMTHSEKAPVLTMVSGALILTGVLPNRRPRREDLPVATGATVGTIIAVVAAFYWLSDESTDTGANPFETLAVQLLVATIFLVFILIVGFFIWGTSALNSPNDPYTTRRKSIVKRVRRQLREIVDDTRSAPFVFNGGIYFAQHDHDISMLFLDNWSMLEHRQRTTYHWKEHENLVENYLFERLLRTAQIAITKHPHQCKYGEIAQFLADQSVILLERVSLIKEFDPLPDSCPECRELKPSHKASCMAAICWRCKYPTPPAKAGCDNASVITLQCHLQQVCVPRGEQATPISTIVRRIRLPFSIPQGNFHEWQPGAVWPHKRREVRRLLEILQQEEDMATRTSSTPSPAQPC